MKRRPHPKQMERKIADPHGTREPEDALAEAAALAPAIRSLLLRAYDEGKRALPWRGETDPYRIWVSEIMLQQTRVETVIPYYKSWLDRFPTLEALAEAEEEEVLRAWQGLGYYSRARNLHRGARVVRERFGGKVPSDPAGLRALPGVGEYTAGALASIAFGQVAPAVDGNVRRVLSRIFDLPHPGQAQLRVLAEELVDPARPGDFNQALMELGALTCTPRSPDCGECPLRGHCAALGAGTVAERPAGKERKPVPEVQVAVLVMVAMGGEEDSGRGQGDGRRGPRQEGDDALGRETDVLGREEQSLRFFLRRRPPEGLLAGMFEFPGKEMAGGEPGQASGLVADAFEKGTALSPVLHAFTHLKATYRPLLVRVGANGVSFREASDLLRDAGHPRDGESPPEEVEGRKTPEAGWFTTGEIEGLPLPVAQQKIYREALRILQGSDA